LPVFVAAAAAVGGWPHARMVLFDADPELATALHRVGVDHLAGEERLCG
jgi:hypothetical protein